MLNRSKLQASVFFLHLCVSVGTLFVLSGCGQLPFLSPPTDYAIEGIKSEALKDQLNSVIDQQFAEKIDTDDAADYMRQENYREQVARDDLLKTMRAEGYYDAAVTYKDAAPKLSGTYYIKAGPQYKITSLAITPDTQTAKLDEVGLKTGMPARAEDVLTAQAALQRLIRQDQCYFSLDVTHTAQLDPATKTIRISFDVKAGPQAVFGPVRFTGMSSVRESYLQKMVSWQEGECFRRGKIEQLRSELLTSGLFSKADAVLPDAPDADGSVPLEINVAERAHRTIKAGLNYYTDEGPGAILGWTHRNYFGAGETVDASTKVSSLQQTLTLNFTKPYFLRKDQSLTLTSEIGRKDTDAYEELAVSIGAGLKRSFTKELSGSAGVNYTLSRIDDELGMEDTYALLSVPVGLTYDSRNDPLNPTKGWLLSCTAEPFYDMFGASDPFLKTQLNGSTYLALDQDRNTIFAVRAAFGSITAAATEDIPATERFYAGGGGSVRGFGYQEVGPAQDGTPLGGRGLAEVSGELRFKITDKIGAVTFVDAGSVSDDYVPNFDNLAVGAGVGLRYYTDFGPVRFDIATPISGDENADQNYQFYISIGQAF